MASHPFRRILLKLSGEVLKGKTPHGFDGAAMETLALQVRDVHALGLQVGLVVGAGNIFRGMPASQGAGGMNRNVADHMGMLATVMNALALRDSLGHVDVPCEVFTPYEMPGIGRAFGHEEAERALQAGRVVVFGGGTGHPFFTTDTTAALRGCEVGADVLLKGTKVNGVYTDDPKSVPTARRYRRLSYRDALRDRLRVMDATAFSLCMENDLPIVVFNVLARGCLLDVAQGRLDAATWVGAVETELAD